MQTIKTVRYQNYWNLLRLSAPWVDLAIVFNQHGQDVWQSERQLHEQMERITLQVKKFQQQAKLSNINELKV